MAFTQLKEPFWSRRMFLRSMGASCLTLASISSLAGCMQQTDTSSISATAIISGAPDDSNPTRQKEFLSQVAEFERLHPHEHIVGSDYIFDPTNYYVRLAAGAAADAFNVYLTEPQFLIAQHAISDITDHIKAWQYFDSFLPSFLELVTGPNKRIYGIPLGAYALGLLYNRKLFQQVGLDPDRPPTTWNEFQEYARRLTRPTVSGFAEASGAHQGGWHFASWMYSIGGSLQQQQGDKWTVTFNSEKGVEVLNLFMKMRFIDSSITAQPLQGVSDILALMATGNVAMAIMAPDALETLRKQHNVAIEDFGLGPMPQNGGNATLAGGNAWVFNPKSSPEVLKTAFDWIMFSNFDLQVTSRALQSRRAAGLPVGLPAGAVFTGSFRQKLDTLIARYANMPRYNYLPYTQALPKLHLRVESLIETQTMYGMLDSVMHAVLTDINARPQELLDHAAHQFQTRILDNAYIYR